MWGHLMSISQNMLVDCWRSVIILAQLLVSASEMGALSVVRHMWSEFSRKPRLFSQENCVLCKVDFAVFDVPK